MGRKKIEIRPLTDERNRNVTFLKRKAGLMKKAWELSVLCAADVSIMIFSSQGKAYEFSSKELDSEIDKYLDYEGLIERRRAEEFAAMAAAGEDDDDDEDDMPRRGSTSKVGPNGQPAPTKSLKGKESFKSRLPSRAELSRAVSRAKEGKRSKRDRRRRRADRDDGRSRGFIEGILSDEDSSDDDERDYLRTDRDERKRRRRDEPQQNEEAQTGLAGLNYALNIHQNAQAEPESLPNFFAHAQPSIPRPTHRYPPVHQTASNGYDSWPPQIPPVDPSLAYNLPQTPAPLPNGLQWDPNLVARFAEYQLQQNHQKQQRVLLERQRAQLAEMGIPVDDRILLDQIFGNGPVNPAMSPGVETAPVHSGHIGAQSQPEEGFAWPTVSRRVEEEPYGYAPNHLSASTSASATTSTESERRYGDVDTIPWGVGGVPTPQSPPRGEKRSDERGLYDAMEERRRRTIMGLPM